MKLKQMIVITLSFLSITSYAGNYDAEDLKKFKVSNSCVSCNLSNVYLWEDHRNANLERSNLSNSTLHGDYTLANFSNTNSIMIYINLASGAKFVNAVLIDAQLQSGNFSDADFTNANVQGANFSNANLYGAKISMEQLAAAASICKAILPNGSKGRCEEKR